MTVPDGLKFLIKTGKPMLLLPEDVELSIELDDLPIEEPMLFDADTFKEKDEDDFTLLSKEDQEEKNNSASLYSLRG